ncbi:Hydroxydechloroatrazine ethylaminohydrolase [Candidatus Calditenuaceae archaeon HR02]|nr:Hydroxydechloroatrazine ethylaminohydrolase [Candidatus Calditenuaceae archaeon HR02]
MREEADILIRKIIVLDPADSKVLHDVDIAIRGGKIAKIGSEIKMDAAEEIEGEGKIAIPGLVDAHTHVFQIFLRGALSLRELQTHPVWLRVLIPFEAELTREEARISAELACINMIKKGITAFADAGGPYPEILAKVATEAGLRGLVTHSTMDAGPENYRRTARMNRELVLKYGKGRVRGCYSIRQIMTSTDIQIDETFRYSREDDALVHMHLSEEVSEIQHSLSRWGLRPIEFLHNKGYLNSKVVAAHCAFLTSLEIQQLSQTGATVVHCPTISMLYMNFPRIPELVAAGVNVALGSDGGSYRPLDLFLEMNVMISGLTGYYGTPYHDFNIIAPLTALRMATYNGAKMFGDGLGRIKEDHVADITIVDIRRPHLMPLHDPTLLPLYATGEDVTDLIVDGRILMRNRKVLTLDEEKIIQESREAQPQILDKIKSVSKHH